MVIQLHQLALFLRPIRLAILGLLTLMLVMGCASTENQTNQPQMGQVPSLAQLNHNNIGAVLIADQTRLHHIHQWWGRPAAQGESGDFQWYNYTYVGKSEQPNSKPGDTQMLTLTVYFAIGTGLLADYDLQLHEFPAHMNQ